MKNSSDAAIAIATTALSALLLVPMPGLAQAPAPANADDKAKAARAERIARQFEAQARVLTVFDREGKVLSTVGERAIYSDLVFSPDQTRLAVAKFDLESGSWDIWVVDVGTGNGTRISSSRAGESADLPVWSPDASQVEWEVMAVDVTTTPTFQAGTPRLLFKLPPSAANAGGNPQQWKNVSGDGQRFVFTVNVPVSVTAR